MVIGLIVIAATALIESIIAFTVVYKMHKQLLVERAVLLEVICTEKAPKWAYTKAVEQTPRESVDDYFEEIPEGL